MDFVWPFDGFFILARLSFSLAYTVVGQTKYGSEWFSTKASHNNKDNIPTGGLNQTNTWLTAGCARQSNPTHTRVNTRVVPSFRPLSNGHLLRHMMQTGEQFTGAGSRTRQGLRWDPVLLAARALKRTSCRGWLFNSW